MKFAYYTPIIQSKLESLEESPGVPLFAEVRYGHKQGFSGFPVAEFFKKGSEAEFLTMNQNYRTWEYTLLLIYEFKGQKTREEAEELMDVTVDTVMTAFEQDLTLQNRCIKVDAVPVNFYDILLEEPFIFAEFSLKIKDLSNIQ